MSTFLFMPDVSNDCRTMNNVDSVGPPDPVSNLRPVKYHVPKNESLAERRLRLKRIEVAEWNSQFWTGHNVRFAKERDAYKKRLAERGISAATADQMSEFYKDFLDRNWRTHLTYNFEWYKRNISIVRLMMVKNVFKAIQWTKKIIF